MQADTKSTRLRAHTQVMVLMSLLKVIHTQEPTDKVVLVSNYTEALDILGKVRRVFLRLLSLL